MPMGIGLGIGVTRGGGVTGIGAIGADLALWFDENQAYKSSGGGIVTPDSILTYTAPSPKMVYGSDGVLRYAPHNLLLRSEEVNLWDLFTVTVSANAAVAPDGTLSADEVTASIGFGNHNFNAPSSSFISGATYTFSAYAKKTTHDYIQLTGPSGAFGASQWATFNLSTGTIHNSLGGTASIADQGNGFFRVSWTAVATSTTSTAAVVMALTNGSSARTPTWSAAGTEAALVWGAQCAFGSSALTYVPTTTAAVYSLPRDHNPTTGAALGVLVEGARTNLLTYSQDISNAAWTKGGITVSNTTGKDGVSTSAQLAVATSANTEHYHNHSRTLTAATVYTFSRYVKASGYNYVSLALGASRCWATFDLTDGTVSATSSNGVDFSTQSATITDVGAGWFRITLTATCLITTAYVIMSVVSDTDMTSTYTKVFTGDDVSGVVFYGAQLEAGAFATSYIPTTNNPLGVTRAADQISILTSAFPYSATAGTVDIDYSLARSGVSSAWFFSLYQNADNSIALRYASDAKLTYSITTGGAAQFNTAGPSGKSDAGAYKVAAAYASNDAAYSVDGATALTDATVTLPTPTVMQIGYQQGSVYLNGHIKRLDYYASRKTDAELVVLST